jgi:hypothetical protein
MHLRAQLLELRFVSTDQFITLQARTLHFRSTESTLGTMKISKRLNWLAIMNTGTTIQFFIKLLMIHAQQTSGLQIQNKTIFFIQSVIRIFSPLPSDTASYWDSSSKLKLRLGSFSSGSNRQLEKISISHIFILFGFNFRTLCELLYWNQSCAWVRGKKSVKYFPLSVLDNLWYGDEET